MRILIHDMGRHPFPLQLCHMLAERGHEILHLYSGQNKTPMGNTGREQNDPAGFQSQAIMTDSEYKKYDYIRRWQHERAYAEQLKKVILHYQPDSVLECTGSTEAHRAALQASRKINAKFIFWLQDINGVAAYKILKKKIPLLGALVGHHYIRIEKDSLRQSDQVILISEDFIPIMNQWDVSPDKLHVIPNWAPLEKLPQRPKENSWSLVQELSDKFCFLYSGSLGLKHNPDLLLQLAKHFLPQKQVRVIVISEGLGADWLKDQYSRQGVENLLILDYQPFETLPDVLAAADVLVSILQPDAGIFSVPSKVNTYLCAGRPLLLAVPSENLAARIVKQSEAGLVADPTRTQEFIDAAERLYNSPALQETMSANARSYAEKHFDIERITDQFEKIIL